AFSRSARHGGSDRCDPTEVLVLLEGTACLGHPANPHLARSRRRGLRPRPWPPRVRRGGGPRSPRGYRLHHWSEPVVRLAHRSHRVVAYDAAIHPHNRRVSAPLNHRLHPASNSGGTVLGRELSDVPY